MDDYITQASKKHMLWLDRKILEGYQGLLPLGIFNNSECLHQRCQECGGTGRRKDGTQCVHMVSCSCPSCSPRL